MGVSTEKKRDNNLDLLRIISMLLIVFLHSIDHSGVLEAAEATNGWISFYVGFTFALTKVCVNCYVLISGYYLVTSNFRFRKLIALWTEAVFYSFSLKAVFMLTGAEPFSFVSLVSCFFPTLTGRYWFLTIYVGLYAVSPFLNTAIRAMDKNKHTHLNLVLFGLFSVWVSLYPSMAGMNSGGGWGLAWFVVLYLCAAWFRLYYTPKRRPLRKLGIYAIIAFLMAAAQWISRYQGIGILERIFCNWFRYDSVPVYLMTLCLFTSLLDISVCGDRISGLIRTAAPATFGVYLIHDHAEVSPWIWETLALPGYMNTAWFPVIQLASVFVIFIVCTLLDMARVRIFRFLKINVLEDKLADQISRKVSFVQQELLNQVIQTEE